MDTSTVSRLSVKFSRFHSSQQCDERKAVKLSNGSIAKQPCMRKPFAQIIHSERFAHPRRQFQQHCASFRESSCVCIQATPVPMHKQGRKLIASGLEVIRILSRRSDYEHGFRWAIRRVRTRALSLHHRVAAEVAAAARPRLSRDIEPSYPRVKHTDISSCSPRVMPKRTATSRQLATAARMRLSCAFASSLPSRK